MFITIYKVTAPQVIEEFIDTLEYDDKSVLVHIDYLAICKADIRYFLGNRDINVLNHKYPLAPIHEAVGHVIKDPTNTFKINDKVILIPNDVDKNKCQGCKNIRCYNAELGENYCPYAIFRSSNADGFMRQFYACKPSLLVKYDESVDPSIAVFSELLSVAHACCRRIDFSKANNIALFGDGIMGYIMYILLTKKYHKHITVFGLDERKLELFKDADKAKYDYYTGDEFDTLIECVGGKGSETAINQMINLSQIGADIILMGVSENNVSINTRKILEKGITIKGVTRSSREDFVEVSKLLNDKKVQEDLKPLVLSIGEISSVNDVYKFYELEINNTTIIGKNIMKF